jgi:uncharacterized protein (DUF1800 family)
VQLQTAVVTGAFEREAIRPRVFGRFEDLLVASTRHPAMLLYLDQAQSFGPNSVAGRVRRRGLNENLAREILELHTVGADAGYTQGDVTEFARALTGWSIGGLRERAEVQGRFRYRQVGHEPGERTVMGRSYPDRGEHQALNILKDLAADPRTARRTCRRLARHFVADDPPESLVARLTEAWTRSGGRLDVVAHALIEAPEAWDPEPRKLKTPYEFLVSAHRAVGAEPQTLERLAILTALGQRPFSPPSPKGWPDEAAAWAAADAVIKRLEYAKVFAAYAAARFEPKALARTALGARMGERTGQAVARAESRQEAIAVLLMSPEFQRR